MLESIEKQVSDYLSTKGDYAVKSIGDNIVNNKQNASGFAKQSLHKKVESSNIGASLEILGVYYIKNLETGTLPGTFVSPSSLNAWGKVKGFWSQDNSRPFVISRKILKFGSKVYRDGGRKNVFTNVETELLNTIPDDIAKIIVNTKIL